MANSPEDFMETQLEIPALFVPQQPGPAPARATPTPAVPPKSAVGIKAAAAKPAADPLIESLRRFHEELQAGERPQIEDYLSEIAPPWREALFHALLKAELTAQLESGEPLFIFRGQYLDRFPAQKHLVERIFAELDAGETTDVRNEVTADPGQTDVGSDPTIATNPRTGDKTSFGRFRVIRELGAGANGQVFLAHDPKLGRDVAIKIPHPGRLKSEVDVERFLRAARAAAQLRHENLCPVYEVNDVPGHYFLVMAFIKGKPLSHYLTQQKRLPIRQAVLLAKLVAAAMAEPHQKGIVHRDLKPDNIQIDEERRAPVVMDFGLAHFEMPDSPQLTQDGQLLGTPYYMSPEQAVGHSEEIGPASDLYALGVILYEMLTGQRPITGRTVGEVLKNVHIQQPVPLSQHRPEIDQKLNDLCLKAIAKSPADRFASMTEFAKELSGYLKTLKS